MASSYVTEIKKELWAAMTRPYRLPRSLLISAIGTVGYLIIAASLHLFHKGLPYATAEVFIWTMASYNASQLGSDPAKILSYPDKKTSLKDVFIIKNSVLLIISIPIDIILIATTCWYINDWSKFWYALILGVAAVIISLGLGNIVSVAWVYQPISMWKLRKDRLKIAEYLIFVTLSYSAASLALTLATFPASIILSFTNLHRFISVMSSIIILFIWAVLWWILSLKVSQRIASKYNQQFLRRLEGEPMHVKNKHLKKILKTA